MTAVPVPLLALIALLGLVVGSFLNVVIDRLPRGESIASPRSRCPHCRTAIKARHNIPILGWLVLRGQCASCHAPISVRYLLVEAGTASLMVALTLRFGMVAELPAYLFFACVAVTLALIDADVRRLPDTIVLPAYVVGTLLLMPASASHDNTFVAVRAALGVLAFVSVYLALQLAGPTVINSGDVKLAGLLGLFLGWLSWGALLVGIVIGLLVGGAAGMRMSLLGPKHSALQVAYGPCMIGGAATAVFVTAPLLSWYGALIGTT